MNRLWTFGDSYTYGAGCIPYGYERIPKYTHNYKKEGDDIWPNHLANMLNLEVKNFGKPGASNDYIIDSIIDQWNFIKEGDCVIISITYHNRFDMPYENELLNIFFDDDYPNDFPSLKKEEKETIINFQYYFANNELYKKRHLKRYNFLTKLLKEKKVKTYLWNVLEYSFIEQIWNATNGEIHDCHFSFKGHKDFADTMYKRIINPTLL